MEASAASWPVHQPRISCHRPALPVEGAVGLVVVSVVLTFIAGLIPSGLAAKKDPVEALRNE